MKRAFIAIFAAGLAFAARADIPPSPPSDPIPEACKPLIGIWARTEPERTRWSDNWDLLVIDSQHATKVYYVDQKGVNVEAQTGFFNIDCRPEADGTMTISLDSATDEEGSATMAIKLSGDSFTTQYVPGYEQPGPPPANWNPPPVTVTYKRIVP